jgi:hypothetical protein
VLYLRAIPSVVKDGSVALSQQVEAYLNPSEGVVGERGRRRFREAASAG